MKQLNLFAVLLFTTISFLHSDPFQDSKVWSVDEINTIFEHSFNEKEITFILLPLDSFESDQVSFQGNYYLFYGENASKFSSNFRVTRRHLNNLPANRTTMALITYYHDKFEHEHKIRPYLYFTDDEIYLSFASIHYELTKEFQELLKPLSGPEQNGTRDVTERDH